MSGVEASQQRVFVSYRHEDTGQVIPRFVEQLVKLLGEERVFWDVESLKAGQNWQEELQGQVEQSTVVFAFIGKRWLLAHDEKTGRRRLDEPVDWVRCELEWALAKAAGIVVPVLVDGATMPTEEALPPSLVALPSRQARLLRSAPNRDWTADLKQLLIESGLQSPPAPEIDAGKLPESADPYLLFRVSKGTVTCSAPGEAGVPEQFELVLDPGKQSQRDLEKIKNNTCIAEDIRNLGRELWLRLRPGKIESMVNQVLLRARNARSNVVEIRLAIERELEGLPWEAVDDDVEDCLSISSARSVSRVPFADKANPIVRALTGGKLRLIVIIPGGSGLQSSSEWEKIQEALSDAPVEMLLLDGKVTPDVLAQAMRTKWDVIHFIGHGRHEEEEHQFKLRFNAETKATLDTPPSSELWMPAAAFVQTVIRAEPQIVVLNCCDSAGMEGFGSSIGSMLLKRGVPAAVMMRYEIRDDAAAEFSRAFYRELLAGSAAGDVGLAVQEGRAALHRSFPDRQRVRSHITPVLYLAEGCRKLLEGLRAPRKPIEVVHAPTPGPALPEALLTAMSGGYCLPILGPGVLSADAVRRAVGSFDQHKLGEQIAKKSSFPDLERLHGLAESSSHWLVPLLFQRYCQHFEALQSPSVLSSTVQQAYRGAQTPAAVELIASWNVPGFAYTHQDGLLEAALFNRGRKPRPLQPREMIEDGVKPTPGTLSLLTLRGHFNVLNSMVLTEFDEDFVVDGADEIAACVLDLMRPNSNTSLLFLGVSPRDPIVRALARRLLTRETARSRGIAYFVAQTVTPADRGYWEQFFNLKWLELPNDTVIRALTAASRTLEEGSR